MAKGSNRCPECDAFVKPENLAGHLRKAHGMSEAAARVERSSPRPRGSRGRRGLPVWVPVFVVLVTVGVVGGAYWASIPPGPPPPLTEMCVQHVGGGLHNHVNLHIIILGLEYSTPANMSNIGIVSSSCYRPIHTHTDPPVIHIELPGPRDAYIRDFFTIWGRPFSSTQIMSYGVDATHTIDFTVDGVPNTSFQDLLLLNAQQIVIEYRST